MLGYAWQKGLIPVSHESIEQAIRLNGVAVQANLDAFAWGRVMAVEPERLPKTPPGRRAMEDMGTEELIAHRRAHLTAYQGRRLADRYAALVARVEAAAGRLSDKETARKIVRSVAHGYDRVLAYKDEYEVARLLTQPEFRKGLEEAFEGDTRIALNLAPPFLAKPGPTGRPEKREFGPWMLSVLGVLARLKGLRGTPLDLFGRTEERRAERALIGQYEADVEKVLSLLDDRTAPKALALLDLYNQIRGFGPVKAAAMEQAAQRRARLLAELDRGAEPPTGQALAAE
jgi:indolepyruvate ferredoxin oxidoreductase